MNEDLYFVPMIAEALGRPDPAGALARAFERIRALGCDERRRNGYQQFLRFMDSVARSGSSEIPEPP